METTRQQVKEAEANFKRINNTSKQQLAEAQANLDRINITAKQQINEAEANLARTNSTAIKQLAEAELLTSCSSLTNRVRNRDSGQKYWAYCRVFPRNPVFDKACQL